MKPKCFLIIGFGSIGKRHLKNLRELEPNAFIIVVRRPSADNKENTVPKGADQLVHSVTEALDFSPVAAIIANPAPFHINIASELIERNIHVMIEKPISDSVSGVEQLIENANQKSLVLMTAYNFRFSEAAQQFRQSILNGAIGKLISVSVDTGQYLPSWRPGTDYRKGVSAKAALGGGVLLELSHEFDYLRWIFGDVSSVYARCAKSGILDIDLELEESVDMLLAFESGLSATVHVDFIQVVPHRICKVIGAEGTLIWDAVNHEVRINTLANPQGDFIVAPMEQRNDMYLDEIRHFIECIESGTEPNVSGSDGLAALNVALAAKRSAKTKQVINLR